jgi:hypothetical protein
LGVEKESGEEKGEEERGHCTFPAQLLAQTKTMQNRAEPKRLLFAPLVLVQHKTAALSPGNGTIRILRHGLATRRRCSAQHTLPDLLRTRRRKQLARHMKRLAHAPALPHVLTVCVCSDPATEAPLDMGRDWKRPVLSENPKCFFTRSWYACSFHEDPG